MVVAVKIYERFLYQWGCFMGEMNRNPMFHRFKMNSANKLLVFYKYVHLFC